MKLNFKQKNVYALQGDLSVVAIENLMQFIGQAELYGELQIKTDNNSAVLFVYKGTLIYCYLKNNPLKIGQYLTLKNYISNEQLKTCLSMYENEVPRPRIGRILVEKGYLQVKDLKKVHKAQGKASFFEILSWKRGSFAFLVKRIPPDEDILLQERIDHLTLEGVLRVDEQSDSSNEVNGI